ncbi:probable glutamate--tRNA ligase, mitochondrial [Physella acuta]|uniref:probable glutamate--tRNA ligase, mitochondrial n=1 Tax=Physella acuta TaxID=109671 RepID=UPI0027DE916F|nr:probable glutamate--tRNA ligase, mitochondrial [Physella acuta]
MMKTSHFPLQCFRHCIAFHPQKLIKSRDNKACYLISRHCSTKTQPAVRVRFAPSPTGYLHLGGLRTALYNFLFARSHNGTFILRIEDTDQSRAVPGAIEYLQNTLHWAGIDPDEGPVVGGRFGPYIQSERLKIYQENIQTLLKNGWAYRCFCTERRLELMRKEAARKGEPSRYDNRCRSLAHSEVEALLAQGTEHVIRLKLEPTPDPWDDMVKGETSHDIEDIEGDPVLMKSDGYPTYHFANVVDDHLMEVSHVLRGSEWLPSTPKHILLYKAFGWQPPKFGHMPLIVNQDGTKLSKRQGDIHVDYFRELGCFPQAVLNYITTVGGGFQKSTLDMTLQEMCSSFDVRNIRRNSGRLSPMWLQEANRLHIKKMVNSNDASVVDDLVSQVRQLVVSKFNDRLGEGALREQVLRKDYIVKIIRWSLLEDRTSYLTDFVGPDLEYLWVTPSPTNLTEVMLMEKNAITLLTDFMHWVSSVEDFSLDNLNTQLKLYLARKQLKPKKYFALIRTALTGLKQGAPIAEMLHVIGHDNITHRLETVLESLKQLPSSSGQNV